MRLGLIVIASETGLGYQTLSYYKHLNPHKILLVDISDLNGSVQHHNWYENAHYVKGIPTPMHVKNFLQDIDVLMTAETPYSMRFYDFAKLKGIKTVCVENPEFYDHIKYPEYPMPDLIILPSVWMQKEITMHANSRGVNVVQLHHPVDREEFPFRLRRGNRPLHIAGKPAAHDRNGTWDFMQACPDGTVVTQSQEMASLIRKRYRNARVVDNVVDNKRLYDYGDFLVMPRRYGGNCLPLNEALSTGMPVIMPDISPNDNLLPKEWLVPAHVTGSFAPRTAVNIYSCNIEALQEKIAWFRQCDMAVESEKANKIADTISWKTLKPEYIATLEKLVAK